MEEKKQLKSFNDLKDPYQQPNHPIRKLMLMEGFNYTDRKYVLMYTPRTEKRTPICFIGKHRIEAFMKFYDYLNTEKCLCPFDRHTTCLDSFLDEYVFKGKEFTEADVLNFDLQTLTTVLKIRLTDAYCNLDLFDDELIGTHDINDITRDPYC